MEQDNLLGTPVMEIPTMDFDIYNISESAQVESQDPLNGIELYY